MENQLYLYFIEFCVSVGIMLLALLFIVIVKYYIGRSRGLTNSIILSILMLVGMVVLLPQQETILNILGYFNN